MPDYRIFLYNRSGQLLARPIRDWVDIDVTLRYNEPGSGLFTVPGYSIYRDAVGPGGRVVVTWRATATAPSTVLIAGPIEEALYERSDDGENAGAGRLTVNFADDLAAIATRITYPDPAAEPESWLVDSFTGSGSAELMIRTLVSANAGPTALAARRIPLLSLGNPILNVSGATLDTRLEMLLDVCRSLANAAGIGFRTVQVTSDTVYFECYRPANRTGTIRYSFELGNLRYLSYRQAAPTGTTALVGGQGEGADRYVTSRTYAADENSWGRAEIYVGRAGSASTLELQEDADEALLDTRATAQLTATTIDSNRQRFGVDYFLGDTVAVSPYPGTQLTARVKTVHIQAWATAGELITPTIGDQSNTSDPATIRKLRDIDRRVRYLERTVKPAVP